MMKRLLLSFLWFLLSAELAIAQGIGGGTQVFQNWYPTGNSPSVSISGTSTAHLFPSTGPTARICNNGSVDAYVNPYGVDNTVTATTSGYWIKATTCQVFNLKPATVQYTYWAAITGGSSTTFYVETGQGAPSSASNSSGSPPFVPTSILAVPTLANMRLLNAPTNVNVYLAGYYNTNDGIGAGSFIYNGMSSCIDNGGTLIQAVSGCYSRLNGLTNVQPSWFGAYLDPVEAIACTTAASSPNLSCTGITFVASDVGKIFGCKLAGASNPGGLVQHGS